MTSTSDNPNRVHAWSYVIVQAVLLVLTIFLGQNLGPQIHRFVLLGWICEWLGIIGILISGASLRKSLTAVPIPKSNGKLSTTGLYRYVRHPMYTSVLLFAIGIAIGSGTIVKYLLVTALYFLFYAKSKYEEIFLKIKYPEYAEYALRIPRFIPFTK